MTQQEKLLHRFPALFLPAGIVRLINKFERIIIYGMIGGVAVVIDVGLFWLLDATTSMPVVLNNGISILAAMIYSFLMNAYFNFRERSKLLVRFVSFGFVTGVGFLISSLMLWTMSEVMGMNSVLVKNLTLPVVFIVQFTLNSKITFRTKRAPEAAAFETVS